MIHPDHLRQLVIRPALEFIGLWSQSAENLLLGTWCVESTVGNRTYLEQDGGPALGGYQMEPPTHQDNWDNFLNFRKQQEPRAKLLPLVPPAGFDEHGRVLDSQLVVNLPYATAQARIRYYRVSDPLPASGNLPALAAYYKAYYNTKHGAGTVFKFMDAYPT